MSSTHSKPTKNVLQLIGAPEGDPNQARGVKFWFYSREEAVIYRLASVLKRKGYRVYLEKTPGAYRWLCIADRQFVPANEPFRNLCREMLELTQRFEVIFEGWETTMPGNKFSSGA